MTVESRPESGSLPEKKQKNQDEVQRFIGDIFHPVLVIAPLERKHLRANMAQGFGNAACDRGMSQRQ
jgi:hypothetical protein